MWWHGKMGTRRGVWCNKGVKMRRMWWWGMEMNMMRVWWWARKWERRIQWSGEESTDLGGRLGSLGLFPVSIPLVGLVPGAGPPKILH